MPIHNQLFEHILQASHGRCKDTPLVLGISGIDTAGKTTFAHAFSAFLAACSYATQLIQLDDFHYPTYIRYAGENEVENYFSKTFDLDTLVATLLRPIREQGSVNITLPLLNLRTDQYDRVHTFRVLPHSFVVLEGVFLYRPELISFIDYKIWLDIPWQEADKRVQQRDIPRFGPEIVAKYQRKYWPAQRRYLATYPPATIADLMIDNSNWEHPTILLDRNG